MGRQKHLLQAVNGPDDAKQVYVDQWYVGARVKLAGKGTGMHFTQGRTTLTDGTTLPNDVCLNVWPTSTGGEALQLWAKKQPGGAVAVFLLNNHQSNTYTDVPVPLEELGLSGTAKVRDIWARTDNGTASGALALTIPPHDSRFVLLTPAA